MLVANSIAIRIRRPRKVRGHETPSWGHCANYDRPVPVPILRSGRSHDGITGLCCSAKYFPKLLRSWVIEVIQLPLNFYHISSLPPPPSTMCLWNEQETKKDSNIYKNNYYYCCCPFLLARILFLEGKVIITILSIFLIYFFVGS